MRDNLRGFSLIEVMIVVAILAILTTIAVPSYRQHVIRSQRTDATSALLRVAAAEEKYYIQNNRYGTYVQLGSPTTEHGYYTLTIPAADAQTFTATATAVGGQTDDPDCATFSVNAAGQHTAKDPSNNDATDHCW